MDPKTTRSNFISVFLAIIGIGFLVGALLRSIVLVSIDKTNGSIWYFVILGLIACVLAFLARK